METEDPDEASEEGEEAMDPGAASAGGTLRRTGGC